MNYLGWRSVRDEIVKVGNDEDESARIVLAVTLANRENLSKKKRKKGLVASETTSAKKTKTAPPIH